MILRRSACRRHRRALTDFVDRRERGPRTEAALDHLERCRRCEREMATLALAIFALRRVGREVAAAQPRPDLRPTGATGRRLRLPGLRSVVAGPVIGIVVVVLAARSVGFQPSPPTAGPPPPAESSSVVRIYDPPAQALTRAVVLGFMSGSPISTAAVARLRPIARDRATPDPPQAGLAGHPGLGAPASTSPGPT